MIRYEKDINNIVTLTLDMRNSNENLLTHDIGKSFLPVLQHLKTEKAAGALRGVIITSAKKTFLVGTDIDFFYHCKEAPAFFEFSDKLSRFFRDLEQPGVPVVAAINGSALGPGFELALACHHRIAIHRANIQLGLPETSLGLIPAGGSIIRLMWLKGMETAYHVVTDGHRYTPNEAFSLGIIDDLARDENDLMDKAREWLLGHRDARRIWDNEGATIPGGQHWEPQIQSLVRRLIAQNYSRHYLNYPALSAVLSVLVEGARSDFDTACRIQSRYFTQVALTKEAKSMLKAFWFDNKAINDGKSRPKGFGKFRPRKIGIIGAGLMGSAIAYACVRAGLDVVLKDISRSVAEKGKNYSAEKLKKMVVQNELTQQEADNLLKKIVATELMDEFKNCDLIIEAVFENQSLKSKILRDAEVYLDEYSIVASNTSSIPITKLAKTTQRPENFCGMRFFRPVDGTSLVEIVKGEQTSDETIARAFDFIRLIRKIPIIVKDSWGFYSGRVRNTYILEGIAMLLEGYSPALIENLGLQTGMPTGPLALADDLGIELALEYETQAAELYGTKYIRHPAAQALSQMIELRRTGRQNYGGFYEYSVQKIDNSIDFDTYTSSDRQIWKGLTHIFPTTKTEFDRAALTERLLFAQVLEATWCLQEGVVQSAAEANLASIYGWRFPAGKGGLLQYANDYGLEKFIDRCKIYRVAFGQRFRVPQLLREMATRQEVF
ncbi:MAG: hypothetical protein RL757_728 [Bacteroidota bacterium]